MPSRSVKNAEAGGSGLAASGVFGEVYVAITRAGPVRRPGAKRDFDATGESQGSLVLQTDRTEMLRCRALGQLITEQAAHFLVIRRLTELDRVVFHRLP